MTKEEGQAINWKIATEWFAGLGLEYAGVPLGDLMMYDLLRVVGNQILIHIQKQEESLVKVS